MLVYPAGKTAEDYKPNEIPNYINDPYYRTDHSTAEVGAFLARVNKCIRAGEFIVLDDERGSRKKNADFLNIYGLYTREKQKQYLLSIDVEDFCHSVRAADGAELYVFCPRWQLYKTNGGSCNVAVYVKHDCPQAKHPRDVVISMHELEAPIELIFAD